MTILFSVCVCTILISIGVRGIQGRWDPGFWYRCTTCGGRMVRAGYLNEHLGHRLSPVVGISFAEFCKILIGAL